MKSRLLIISDLWGFGKSDWISLYTKALQNEFDVELIDCCTLGEVNLEPFEQESLHQQFRQGGVKKAVQKLCEQETGKVDVLAFSIGGTVAWKAALDGLQIGRMIAISATRLRLEVRKPDCKIELIYGERDNFRPGKEWLKDRGLENELVLNGGHRIYTNPKLAKKVCASFLGELTT